jgi:hypothetical protein
VREAGASGAQSDDPAAPAQHLRLRVLSAYERRSAQEIMVQALTSYLDRHGFDAAAD